MKIYERIKHVQAALIKQGTQSTLHFTLSEAAIKAIRGGVVSRDWAKYMTAFADNEQQLKRLIGEDELANEGYVIVSSAYLVANGGCGGHSPTGLHMFIDQRIDDDLPTEPDGKIEPIRIIDI
jgi:hypothetical protein